MVLLNLLIEWWLSKRQVNSVVSQSGTVPDHFRETLSIEDHQKAASYTTAKQRIGQLEMAYGVILLFAWTINGGMELLNQLWLSSNIDPLFAGVGFIFSFIFISSLLGIPFAIYNTFFLESKFGFNKTTITTFITDTAKSILLSILLGAPLIWVILWLMDGAGELWWFKVWAVWMGFTLLMLWAWPTFLAPLFNKFTPLDNSELNTKIENLLKSAGFVSNGIFIMDGSKRSGHGNAYFTGLGEKRRIVFYDTLLESLSDEEILAVLAHELGHFKNGHIKKRLIVSATMSLLALALLGWLIGEEWFYQGLGVTTPSTHTALVLFLLASPAFSFWVQPVMAAYSRKHEFEADEFAAESSDPKYLISALVAMYRENAATVTPDQLYSAYHDSHPPAPVRIAHLAELKNS